jgi:hypothetical protein
VSLPQANKTGEYTGQYSTDSKNHGQLEFTFLFNELSIIFRNCESGQLHYFIIRKIVSKDCDSTVARSPALPDFH